MPSTRAALTLLSFSLIGMSMLRAASASVAAGTRVAGAPLHTAALQPTGPAVDAPKNALGGKLEPCSTAPMTGYFRDGFCNTIDHDHGRHVVCATATEAFLDFTRSRGNDLTTPHLPGFPGLVPGDKWCLCALRWREALEAGVAPPVHLSATHTAATRYVTLDHLVGHSAGKNGAF